MKSKFSNVSDRITEPHPFTDIPSNHEANEETSCNVFEEIDVFSGGTVLEHSNNETNFSVSESSNAVLSESLTVLPNAIPETIYNSLKITVEVIRNLSSAQKISNQSIRNFFHKCIEKKNDFVLTALLDALLENEFSRSIAEANECNETWDLCLKNKTVILDEKGQTFLKKQKFVKSFSLIFGFFIFAEKIDVFDCETLSASNLLALGIKYQSIHCLRLSFLRKIAKFSANCSQEIIDSFLQDVYVRGTPHLSAGYYLYITFCLQIIHKFKDNEQIKENILPKIETALDAAKSILPESKNEIYNANFGIKENIDGCHLFFRTVEDKCFPKSKTFCITR